MTDTAGKVEYGVRWGPRGENQSKAIGHLLKTSSRQSSCGERLEPVSDRAQRVSEDIDLERQH